MTFVSECSYLLSPLTGLSLPEKKFFLVGGGGGGSGMDLVSNREDLVRQSGEDRIDLLVFYFLPGPSSYIKSLTL